MGLIDLVRVILPGYSPSHLPDCSNSLSGSYPNDLAGYKSVGERAIAEFLGEEGIPFWYEKPLLLGNGWYREKFLPDFTFRKKPKHLEYWGMIDHDSGYVRRMRYKMAIYHRNNIDFLSIYPSELRKGRFKRKIMGFYRE